MLRTPKNNDSIGIASGTPPNAPRLRWIPRMKRYLLNMLLITVVNVGLLVGSDEPLAAGQKLIYSARTSLGSHGEVKVRGKGSITVEDLNLVRYKYKIRRQVTEIDAPDVLKLLPFTPQDLDVQSSVQLLESKKEAFKGLAELTGSINAGLSNAYTAQQVTEELIRELRDFIASSEGVPSEVLRDHGRKLLGKIEKTSANRNWPLLDYFNWYLQLILLFRQETEDPQLIRTLNGIVARIESEKRMWIQADEQITAIEQHLRLALTAHDSTGSMISESIDCRFKSRKEDWSLVVFDLFPPNQTGEQKTKKAEAKEFPLVTFVCESSLSFSAGIFTSYIDEEEFDFRPMIVNGCDTMVDEECIPTTKEVIGYNNRSDIRLMPGTVINAQICQACEVVDVHMSLGILADFGGEQGADLEFIPGLTFEISKAAFITVGLHFARVSELQDGFEPGNRRPQGLDTVPTQKSYKTGLGLGLSYRFSSP